MSAVYVVGVGMTAFGQFIQKSMQDMTREAVHAALGDAGIPVSKIEAAYFSNATQGALEGQYMIPGQVALRPLGLEGIPIVNLENACASASTAFAMACKEIRSGDSSVVLAVGAEKMVSPDKLKTMAAFDGAIDVHNRDETIANLLAMSDGMTLPSDALEDTGPRSVFMDVYAAMARFHMMEYGTTQAQIAAVAAKNHDHSVHNERAQFRKSFSVEEVLAARKVCWPLTLPMCSPVSDGASAAILCSEEALKYFDRSRAVKVGASVLVSGTTHSPKQPEQHITRVAALKAYDMAGVAPEDVSVAEVHDATAFGEILQTENLGFCGFGEGGALAASGATRIGGRIPVNPSGGLESKGHPIGATGLGQIFELTQQLRGEAGARQVEGARIAVAENGGGVYEYEEAAACITILEKT
ncbi:thiolase family protein [Sneathiella chinensis]|uniref:Thiolase n=1 Tax=Sneathiella chinensis TaxID=349750 RepID=A0ABQ5U8I4_9PROT|nr:thiolase family protein [Sneathiella chinensis]GLQ06776.1 thiolase [Sneathiella chinensis]